MSFFSDFKAFAVRGNVIDLAIAVVVGASFEKIVSSLVDGIIMPVFGWLSGGINVADKVISIGQVTIKWGEFLQSIINFSIISFVIFIVIKLMHIKYKKKEAASAMCSDEVALLKEIRDLIKKSC
ncbi:MAG: large conductance mechanosensitive channel protein MscL [Legionellaceae bacterium]|nr:large conductance mechanosensitive channel protein MscL [Legionellaceae bacterium]